VTQIGPFIPLLVALALGFIVAMIKWPKVWLATFLLSLPIFLTDSGKGLSAQELAMGGLFTLSITVWIVWRIAADPRPLVRNWMDFLVLLFIALSSLNIVVAMMNHVDPVGWLSEWALFFLILYYFPIREYFGDERGLKQFMTLSAISAVGQALYSMYLYKQRMATGLVYAFQLTASRSVLLGPIFLVAIVFCMLFIFAVRWRHKLILFGIIGIQVAALVLTFTRTLWAFFFVCAAIVMFFLSMRQRVQLVAAGFALAVIAVGGLSVYNPKLADIGLRIVKARFASSTQLSGGDYSFETRVVEAQAAWAATKESPLGGNGLRATFLTYSPLDKQHFTTSFIHFGYVGLIFKLGIPLALLMVAILLVHGTYTIGDALRLRRDPATNVYRSVAAATAAFLPALYVTIFMTGFFDQRFGNVMFAFVFACTSITHDHCLKRTAPRSL
jgi:O-antigen ligase